MVWIWAFVSALFSLLYGFKFTQLTVSLQKTLVKTLPVLALALISFAGNGPMILTVALLFGAVGDACLSRDGVPFFLGGLTSFLLGHLGFCILFLQVGSEMTLIFSDWGRLAAAVSLSFFALGMVKQLFPKLGSLAIPVLIYIAVIWLMGLSALGLPFAIPWMLAIIGAGLFIASDVILSFELFILAEDDSVRRFTSPVLWFLYWGGQSLIVLAFVWPF